MMSINFNRGPPGSRKSTTAGGEANTGDSWRGERGFRYVNYPKNMLKVGNAPPCRTSYFCPTSSPYLSLSCSFLHPFLHPHITFPPCADKLTTPHSIRGR